MKYLIEKEREKILRDYEEVQLNISRFLDSEPGYTNHLVVISNQYLNPSISPSSSLPLDSKRGELTYYIAIRNTLEKLLAGQPAEYSEHFRNAPVFIKKRLKKAK